MRIQFIAGKPEFTSIAIVADIQESVDDKRKKLESFVNRFKAKATKATQARSRMKMLEKLEDVDTMQAYRAGFAIEIPDPPRSSPLPIEVEKGAFAYDGENFIYKDFDFKLEDGEKLAVVGHNGMGKTTLALRPAAIAIS